VGGFRAPFFDGDGSHVDQRVDEGVLSPYRLGCPERFFASLLRGVEPVEGEVRRPQVSQGVGQEMLCVGLAASLWASSMSPRK